MNEKKTHTAQQFSPWSIARTIWKGKWTILGIWLIITIAGAISVQFLPTLYTAQALIQVDSQKIPERFVVSTVSTELQDRISSISQQILSSAQLNKIINDFGLYRKERASLVQEEIIDKMRKDIDIKVDKPPQTFGKNKPGSFRVGYQGPNSSVVAQVANRLAELFINENLKTREVQAEGTSEFIESQLQEAKKKLDTLEAAVSEYKQKHNGELPQQESALGANIARLQTELNATRDAINRGNDGKVMQESNLATAEATLAVLQEQATATPVQIAGQPFAVRGVDATGTTRVILPARKSDALRAQLEVARVRWKEDHPEVKKLKAELEQVEEMEHAQEAAALAAVKATLAAKPAEPLKPTEVAAQNTVPPVPPVPVPPANLRETPQIIQLRERIQTLKTEIELNKRDLEKRKANEQRLLASVADAQAHIEKLPLREQEMSILMRDYGISKDNYQRLLTNKLSAEMSKDMELRQKSERFTVLDPATVPERPSKPNRRVLSAGVSGVGLFLGLVLAFLLELRRDVLLGEWELPADVSVLGTLPRLEDYSATGNQPNGKNRRGVRKRLVVGSAVLAVLAVAVVGLFLLRNRL